jgi:hypothetical protein
MDSAVSLQGALTVGLNSIEELKQIIPDEQTINDLMDFLSSRAKTSALQQQADELGKLLPSNEDYITIAETPAIEQKNLIDEGSSLYPNKILINKAVAEGNLGKVEKLLQSNTPGEMNYYLKLYYNPFSRVIGYTSGETNLIHINWRFFKNYQPSNVAANLAHEWVHKLGFDHASAKEHDSAPYAIGYIVGDMAERILKSNQLIH